MIILILNNEQIKYSITLIHAVNYTHTLYTVNIQKHMFFIVKQSNCDMINAGLNRKIQIEKRIRKPIESTFVIKCNLILMPDILERIAKNCA